MGVVVEVVSVVVVVVVVVVAVVGWVGWVEWLGGWVDHACLYGSISHEKTCSMRSAARPALSWLHASEIIWRARSGASVPEHLFDPTKGVAPQHALAHAHAHAHATIGSLFRRPNRTGAHSRTERRIC